jgi:hypothetical protein
VEGGASESHHCDSQTDENKTPLISVPEGLNHTQDSDENEGAVGQSVPKLGYVPAHYVVTFAPVYRARGLAPPPVIVVVSSFKASWVGLVVLLTLGMEEGGERTGVRHGL